MEEKTSLAFPLTRDRSLQPISREPTSFQGQHKRCVTFIRNELRTRVVQVYEDWEVPFVGIVFFRWSQLTKIVHRNTRWVNLHAISIYLSNCTSNLTSPDNDYNLVLNIFRCSDYLNETTKTFSRTPALVANLYLFIFSITKHEIQISAISRSNYRCGSGFALKSRAEPDD